MGKPFFEVFPSLKLDKKVRDIMEQTTVEKVTATKRKDFLRVYLLSSRLIYKQDVWEAEKQIKNQLFPNANMTVKIYEKFTLSGQYTPKKLLDVYRDSVLEELREYSHVEYNIFKTAEITYPDVTKVNLVLEDTVIARSKEEEILRIVEKILVERCGFSVAVTASYKEAVSGKFAEDDELRLKMEVEQIARRVAASKEQADQGQKLQEAAPVKEKTEEKKQTAAPTKPAEPKKAENKPKENVGEFKKNPEKKFGDFKKSDFGKRRRKC